MAKKGQAQDTAEHLHGFPVGSAEQIDAALRLVGASTRLDVVQAALAALAGVDDPRVRPALLDRYAFYAANGARRDPGCFLRADLLKALRHVARREDAGLLEEAVLTNEFLPPFTGPTRGEAAAGLRSVALVALNEVDDALAGYHAVRLLTDRYTSPMSGEPAVTAVRVLAAQGHVLPLYEYLLGDHMQEGSAEVMAESLRSLVEAPASVLAPLVERYRESENEIVLLGLFDLLLEREDRAAFTDVVLTFARTTRLYNVYRYVVSMIVARRQQDLIAHLEKIAPDEKDRLKAEILHEALALR